MSGLIRRGKGETRVFLEKGRSWSKKEGCGVRRNGTADIKTQHPAGSLWAKLFPWAELRKRLRKAQRNKSKSCFLFTISKDSFQPEQV